MEAAGLIVSAVGLSFSIAQTILAALQCDQLKDLFGSDLDGLRSSVETIQAVLLDAESKQAHGIELSAQERNFIHQIKDVVYDADDLLDVYVTRAKRQQINMESGHKLSSKVHRLCSSVKNLAIASPEIKRISKNLEKIGRDAKKFKYHSVPIRRIREETYSYVIENDIVGREDDQRRIVDMLLHSIIQGEPPVLAIVGMGGLGKTALAQLVYKDHKIQNEFSLRLWVCVSDQGGKQFNLKAILEDIYKVVNPKESIGDMGLEVLVQEFRSKLDENKYLLVLDDLWSENRDECHKLVDILRGSVERGSRILVTTRSKETSNAIGSRRPYQLHCLSDENSWHLFEKKVGREIKEGHDLFEICKDIVKKCVNVPLAIKVVGSLLHDMPENKWQSFRESRLFEFKKYDNDIMQILKFSYYHLSPSLKSCFTYCALFPKDFEIQKENLNSMWMAHDYAKDEDEAEDHFQILVQRCFFQDIKENLNREIVFKIHNLMHDMAQEVAGKEIYLANSATNELDKNICHLNDGSPKTRTKAFVTPAKIRSYVHHNSHVTNGSYIFNFHYPVGTILAKWRHLRVLDLHELDIRQLPKAIGDLLHLRYLDLSGNRELRMLPEALTKLNNLHFLNLDSCSKLNELPRDLKKLVNLRTLYVPDELEYMPLGMAKMTSLSRLNRFIVGHTKSSLKQKDKLEDLRGLRNLKGSLEIRIKEDYKDAKEYCGEGGYIWNTQHLHSICIEWFCERNEGVIEGNDEDLLEDLRPHHDLKELEIGGYTGARMAGWLREDSLTTSLPNLVKIYLYTCKKLEELPWLGRLQHLKILRLKYLENVEYMENRRIEVGSSSSNDGGVASKSSTILFFPSLEQLELECMPNLKGWWRGSCISMLTTPPAHLLVCFPRLSELYISNCPNLRYIPPCSAMELRIQKDAKLMRLSEFEEVFRSFSSSLQSLKLEECNKLRSVGEGGLEYLTVLQQLQLHSLPELKFEETEEKEEEMPWRSPAQSLHSLSLSNLQKVDNLPKGMRYLTSLKFLMIQNLPLKEIPEWIGCLTSLQSLEIKYCYFLETLPRSLLKLTSLKKFELQVFNEGLERRCEKPNGEYWPILGHIPQLHIEHI